MNNLICAILLAFSLSLDSLGISASYGIKNIKIPLLSKLTMSFITFIISLFSLYLGSILSMVISDFYIKIISFLMLTLLAVSMLIPSRNKNNSKPVKENIDHKKIFSMFIKWAGLTITIIKEPLKGDADNSEVIEFKEALCIGASLSLDSLCACMGFSESSTGILIPILISVFQFTFMYIGERLGNRIINRCGIYEKFALYLPPLILILIAFTRLA